ncbi:MAG: hypothetical protein IIB76_12150 [Proteobacteria bacterium]|nr:hypothetical protein [Pseudomonadota bacterium]
MTERGLKFPDRLTAPRFLQQYWQKTPLNMPGAIDFDLPTLSGDELGWLATLEDVESRLVFTERSSNKISYRVEHGPFAKSELEKLPPQDWTLLIQDVEKHLPDFRACFELTAFIPDWRVDDLMVSFAAPGGSVGPHLDHYDVFLCQGSGGRHWQLAAPGSVRADPDSGELSLLETFHDESPIVAASGDVLYLPPGVPHWGIASTACLTYSIGMRAPTRAELLSQLAALGTPTVLPDNDAENVFYQDPDLTLAEAVPGLITDRAVERAGAALGKDHAVTETRLATALGIIVTEPKPWLRPASMDAKTSRARLAALHRNANLSVHGMARLAYFESGDACIVFANGFHKTFSGSMAALIRDLCQTRALRPQSLQRDTGNDEVQEALLWLSQQGVFDL